MPHENKFKPGHILLHRTIAKSGPVISSSHKSLLQTLVSYGQPDGKNILVSSPLLAKNEGFTVQWIRKLLRDLEAQSYIRAVYKKGGRGLYSQYELCLEKFGLAAAPETTSSPATPETANSEASLNTSPPPDLPDWVQDAELVHARLKQRVRDYEGRVQRNPGNTLYHSILEEARENLRVFELEREAQHATTT